MEPSKRTDDIVLSPLKKGEGRIKIDFSKAAKALAVIAGVCLGPKGFPAALANLPDALKTLVREVGIDRKVEAQGFVLYTTALTAAIGELLSAHAPALLAEDGTKESVTGLIIGALNREELHLDSRFFRSPALNPGFVRVKERLLQVLESPAVGISEEVIDVIGTRLGTQFAVALNQITKVLSSRGEFEELLRYFEASPFDYSVARGWIWDDYRSAINKKVYQRLFLHEMEGHPDVGLADVYVPSRAIYKQQNIAKEIDTDQKKVKIHAVDLERHLTEEWLAKSASKGGISRLLTGDPGCGKSTFSLMFARSLLAKGWRVMVIPANSVRSLTLSLKDILSSHLLHTLKLDAAPNIEAELVDPENTTKPLLIIIDGLDEYDVAGMTVSMSAALLAEHALQVTDEWSGHGHNVRLLLCGRPEAAGGLTTRFRECGQHLHVTGFLAEALQQNEIAATDVSKSLLEVDQREDWWRKWQANIKESPSGLPEPIRNSSDAGVREITSQPLLNYMLAVLKLYDESSLTNLSALYGELFSRYYDRQAKGKSSTFESLCPTLDRFKRIMSEIGLAAWHAGDRSVSIEDLRARFDRPPLKSWFEKADRSHNSGLGAILSAFYTRPEDASSPHSGLAERYVFTHKSFREYLTAVGLAKFLERLSENLNPEAEDGGSDTQALSEWMLLFGATAIEQRQWEFLETELQLVFSTDKALALRIKTTCERVFEFMLMRRMPLPVDASTVESAIQRSGNAEEAMIAVLSAVRTALKRQSYHKDSDEFRICVNWDSVTLPGGGEEGTNELRELMNRLRSRPGAPDGMALLHVNCLFEIGSAGLNRQLQTQFRRRPDNWEYASSFDFTSMNLSNVDFREGRLLHARFHRADLHGANFSGAYLHNADMSYTSNSFFPRERTPGPTRFVGTEMKFVTFYRADLMAADFTDAVLDGSNLEGAEFNPEQFKSAVSAVTLIFPEPKAGQRSVRRRKQARAV